MAHERRRSNPYRGGTSWITCSSYDIVSDDYCDVTTYLKIHCESSLDRWISYVRSFRLQLTLQSQYGVMYANKFHNCSISEVGEHRLEVTRDSPLKWGVTREELGCCRSTWWTLGPRRSTSRIWGASLILKAEGSTTICFPMAGPEQSAQRVEDQKYCGGQGLPDLFTIRFELNLEEKLNQERFSTHDTLLTWGFKGSGSTE